MALPSSRWWILSSQTAGTRAERHAAADALVRYY